MPEYAYRVREHFNVKTDFRYSIVERGDSMYLRTEYNRSDTGWKISSGTEIVSREDRQVVNSLFRKEVLTVN